MPGIETLMVLGIRFCSCPCRRVCRSIWSQKEQALAPTSPDKAARYVIIFNSFLYGKDSTLAERNVAPADRSIPSDHLVFFQLFHQRISVLSREFPKVLRVNSVRFSAPEEILILGVIKVE